MERLTQKTWWEKGTTFETGCTGHVRHLCEMVRPVTHAKEAAQCRPHKPELIQSALAMPLKSG